MYQKFKGLSTSSIKRIALVLMLFDHMHILFPNIPEIFIQMSRISWPLFAFCCVEGVDNTNNKKLYMHRLYICSVVMAFAREVLAVTTKGKIYMYHNIFATYHNILVAIYVIRDEHITWRMKSLIFLVWQALSYFVIYLFGIISIKGNIYYPYYFLVDITGNMFLCEGGFLYCFVGIVLYFIKDSDYKLILWYTIICCLFEIITVLQFVSRLGSLLLRFSIRSANVFNCIIQFFSGFPVNYLPFNSKNLYWEDHRWLIMLGALPIMLLYNHERGNYKRIFYYLFYPIHLIVLYLMKYFICV